MNTPERDYCYFIDHRKYNRNVGCRRHDNLYGINGGGSERDRWRADLEERIADWWDTVEARATFDQPQLTAKGIEKVWVNGGLVWNAGRWTGNKPGAVVLGPGANP